MASADKTNFHDEWGSVPTAPGLTLPEMMESAKAGKLKALYVVGANPVDRLSIDPFAFSKTFVVVQEMFLTETAFMADIVLPAANAYEKSGTFTNTCGDLQLVKKAGEVTGTKSDFEMIVRIADAMGFNIRKLVPFGAGEQTDMGQSRGAQSGEADRHAVWLEAHGLEPKMSPFEPTAILDEIQRLVPGYDVSRINLLAGNDQHTTLSNSGPGTVHKPELIQPANDNLFSSGTLGRYSKALNSVIENHQRRAVGSRGGLGRSHKRSLRLFVLNGLTNKETALSSLQVFIFASVIKIVLVILILLTAVAYTVWLERKVVGHMQNRWGPSRVGPFGLLQPLADGIKFLVKEDLTPPHVYKPLFIAAPMIAVICALTSISVIPFGTAITVRGYTIPLQITDLHVGLLVILGITSVGVYGVALAGWSSNSKYSLLGGLRASAQMVSYEICLGLSLVGVLIVSGSFSLREIVESQSGHFWGFIPKWNIFYGCQFVAFFIYLMAAYAETNRIPFDLPEAETELVAGYHTEYSAMKFAMFFMAEYANMITVACLATLLFLGGWSGPVFGPPLLQVILPTFWFVAKIFVFLFIYIWVRGTLPRFRYDQLMAFGWKFLFPLAIANLVITALVVAYRS